MRDPIVQALVEWAERRLGRGPGRDRRTERWKLDDLATDIIEAVEFAPSTEEAGEQQERIRRDMESMDFMYGSGACASTPTPKASEDAREHTTEVVPGLRFVQHALCPECKIAIPEEVAVGDVGTYVCPLCDEDLAMDGVLVGVLSQPEPHTPSGDADSSCNEAQIASSPTGTPGPDREAAIRREERERIAGWIEQEIDDCESHNRSGHNLRRILSRITEEAPDAE